MKKSIIYTAIICLITTIVACDVSESEPATATDANGNQINTIDQGSIEANDSIAFITLLADTVSKVWETNFFTLAGSDMFTSCRLDDVFTFYADGKYDYAGGQLCNAEDNQKNRNGVWELDYTAKRIYFDRGSRNEYVAEVIGLEENELRVKGSYMNMEVRGLYSSN